MVEGERTTEEACQEEERCEEGDLNSHSKRAIISEVLTDSQDIAFVEFVKDHPELYGEELSSREQDMANFPSNSLDRLPESLPEDSH